MVNNSYLCTAFPKITCTRSSMDRIKDSGSFDKGSIPFGCTRFSKQKQYTTMKKFFIPLLIALALPLQSLAPADPEVITKENGMTVINTATLGREVIGYVGATPLKIYIKKNKVEKIEALKNQETPKYFAKVKKALLEKWNGLKVKDAQAQQVDAVTGATFSSEAVIKNVQLGLDYYQNHK